MAATIAPVQPSDDAAQTALLMEWGRTANLLLPTWIELEDRALHRFGTKLPEGNAAGKARSPQALPGAIARAVEIPTDQRASVIQGDVI